MKAYTLSQFLLSQKIFWRTPASVVVAFGLPLLFGGLMPLIMPDGEVGGATMSVYMVTGVIVMVVAMTGFLNLVEALVGRRQALILKRLRGTELPDLAIFGGEILTVIAVGLLQLVLLIAMAKLLHGIDLPADPALLVVTLIAGLAVFAALAVAASGRVPGQGTTVMVSMPVLLLTIGFSGFAYPVSEFPGWLRAVAAVLPITPIAQGVRTAYVGRDFVHQTGSAVPPEVGVLEGFQVMGSGWLVLAAWLVAALWAGKRWFRWEPRRG
ncbi:ABC transporter permease [Microtetraspora malaysiensis]|uniref:ABC transporter permease n=1 Tax=Microtetraspora malaysiensis TaxID=161358 RepID=A0ABW6SJ23_9ACTN